MTAKEKLL